MNNGKLVFLFLWTLHTAHADTLAGRVVAVTDGDTIRVLDDTKTEHRVRLYGIDAPEKAQDYGQRSKQALSDLVYNRPVRVEYKNRDQYGRIVGKVYRGGEYVNLTMVADGMAWHYVQYARHDDDLQQAQEQAKAAKRGLWARADVVPPWEFRRARRK
ncbi:thermonuclease family protein [Akkermansia glycaniphila]|nr:thermonuclease family protein [Akkermansia glycaniphila]